jgi:serine/threonine-protein kinase
MLGSYELLSKIGAGGMGEVWHARHVALERSAAIKLIRVEALQGSRESAEHALVRFEREARATAALRSPHTVELYDYGQAPDGSVYYAMELLEGLDLQSLVERHGPLPPERAVHLLQQICSSLEEAHRQGLLHRDIKPANIFACHLGTAFDVVKVLDFGLVKLRGIQAQQSVAITRADAVTGTPLCLAPEIVVGEIEPDQRSDLYSIGCVAYWLLAGKPVFAADTPIAMAVAHATETPIPPTERNVDSKCSPELEAVVLSCLAKDPADRPESAAELASRLVACPVRDTWTPERAEAWWLEHAPELASSSSHSASSILSKSR